MAAAVLLLQKFLILSQTDTTGHSSPPRLFSPKTAEQKGGKNKTKERSKGKAQSTAVH